MVKVIEKNCVILSFAPSPIAHTDDDVELVETIVVIGDSCIGGPEKRAQCVHHSMSVTAVTIQSKFRQSRSEI